MADSEAASGFPLFAKLQMAAKIILGAAAIAYAIGVFLVSSDLAKYRVSNFSLARPQYVLAGAAWLVTTSVAIGLPFLAALVTKLGDFGKRGRFGRVYFAILAVVFCALVFTQVVEVLMPSEHFFSLMPYATVAETVFFLIAWPNLPAAKEVHEQRDNKPVSLVPAAIGFAVVALFFWTLAYNVAVFPNVETSLGGGKHPKGRVVFCQPKKDEELQLIKMLGPFTQTNLTTDKPLTIVMVDSDFVVLADDNAPEGFQHGINRALAEPVVKYKTILVKKSLVASILYD